MKAATHIYKPVLRLSPVRPVIMKPAALLLLNFVVSLTSASNTSIGKKAKSSMKPLIVLLSVFGICAGITAFLGNADFNLSGRIAMSAMLAFTAMGHFKFTEGMAMMLPAGVPAKKQIVWATGVIEILAAIGLLISTTIQLTGILLIVFFLMILPANIYATMKNVNLEKADYTGNGMNYLWFRISEQIFFIAWVYFFTVTYNHKIFI